MTPVEAARITPWFDRPPYSVESYPLGSCVVNRDGFNCLSFTDKPGAKFTDPESAQTIADRWNSL